MQCKNKVKLTDANITFNFWEQGNKMRTAFSKKEKHTVLITELIVF